MGVVSWARKEVARLRNNHPKALLLPPTTPSPTKSPPVSLVQEVVIAADICCSKCQMRIADTIAKMNGVESMEVNVLQKKVKIASRSMASK